MSESQSQSYKPAPVAAKRVSPVIVWALILLVAIGAFSAAVVMAGGVSGVADLVGVGGLFGSSQTSGGPGAPAASASSSGTPVASKLPTEALSVMYAEQLESQPYITDLADGKVATMKLGTPIVAGPSADIPVTVQYKTGGAGVKGAITLKQYGGVWYFVSVHSPDEPDSPAGVHTAFDSSVVDVITREQGSADTQELIKDGLLGGGYKVVSLAGTVSGSGTKTLKVDLTGGSEAPEHGQFVLIEKVEGANTYWFIARFEKTK